MTDFVISNDLIVFGMSTFAGGQTFDGQTIVDVDSAEALLVRKDGDAGDVFTVDTNNSLVTLNGSIVVGATNPASSGSIRLPNAGDIIFRNSANNGDLSALSIGPTNFLEIGLSGTPWPVVFVYSGNTIFRGGIVSVEADSTLAFQVKSVTPSATIFEVDTVADEVTIAGTVQGTLSASFALLNEAASATNPTLIPRRADLTTGIGGTDGEGTPFLHLITDGVTRMVLSAASVTFTLTDRIQLNASLHINGEVDQIQLQVQGHSTQNADIVLVEQSDGTDLFTIDNAGQVSGGLSGSYALLNETSSGTNPTLIPNRGDLTTGLGVGIGEGTTLHLVVAGGSRVECSAAQTIVRTVSTVMNGRLDILGDNSPTDQVTLLVRGVSGQTLDIAQFKAFPSTNVLTIGVDGVTTLGEGLSSPIDALILDSAALTGDGQRDSHAILLTGKGFETATPHDIDWKAFVNVTADDGTGSIWTLQTRIDAAGYVDQLTIEEGGVATFAGNLAVSGVGPHAIAGAPFGAVQLLIGSTFTSDGSSNIAGGLFHTPTIVGAPGDTVSLTGTTLTAGITTQTATESITNISQLQINEPFITDNLTGSIGSAQSLLITGAPTEGNSNWALKIVSGDVNFGGDLLDIGTGGGDIDILFRGCSTLFIATRADEMLIGTGAVSTANASMSIAQNVRFRLRSPVGDFSEVKRAQGIFNLNAGSSVTVASLIPAGSFVVGITARVTTAVTGPAGFDIGDGIDVDRWGNSIAVGLGTTVDITDYTAAELTLFPTANDIVITSDGVDFTAGVVRVIVHYMSLSAPTS